MDFGQVVPFLAGSEEAVEVSNLLPFAFADNDFDFDKGGITQPISIAPVVVGSNSVDPWDCFGGG